MFYPAHCLKAEASFGVYSCLTSARHSSVQKRRKDGTSQSRIGDRTSHYSVKSKPPWRKTAGLCGARASVAADPLERCSPAPLPSIIFVRVITDQRRQCDSGNIITPKVVAQRSYGFCGGSTVLLGAVANRRK